MPEKPLLKLLRPIHPFPARMAPVIAMAELQALGQKTLRVLDPMAGSGTTLVLARMLGHQAFGFDVDPLAVLLSRAWSATNSEDIVKCADRVLQSARRRLSCLRLSEAYPRGADEETKKFIRYWFDAQARRQLRALADSIRRAPEVCRDLLWVAFSRMIIAKARGVSLAADLSHSRPHRVCDKAPLRPFDAFLQSVAYVANAAPFVGDKIALKGRHPKAQMRIGDARKLPCRANSFDLIVTSPPYLNAIDYLRCSKFALVWMGHSISDLRATRTGSIGAEVSLSDHADTESTRILHSIRAGKELPARWRRVLHRYISDMHTVLSESHRVLRPNGSAVIVVGESRLRGVFVPNATIIEMAAESVGLEIEHKVKRRLVAGRRYLPPPSSSGSGEQLGARMGYEVILRFRKNAG
jgi:DNA modification methylase